MQCFLFACDNIVARISRLNLARRTYAFLRKMSKKPIVLIKSENELLIGPNNAFALLALMYQGLYERITSSIIRRLLKKNDVVIDVGAGFGYFTLLSAKIVGPKGIVFAFEPEPLHYVILQLNVKLNNLNNVHIFNYAVANFNGIAKLFVRGEESSLFRRAAKVERVVLVRVVRLDDVIPYSLSVDLIKMDIEGAEPLALEGMHEIIKRSRDLKLIIELNSEALRDAGFQVRDLIGILHELGFRKLVVIDEIKENIKGIHDCGTQLLNKITYTINLLCIRG